MKIVALLAVLVTCPSIDPGNCRPRADEQPFGEDKAHVKIDQRTLTAAAVLADSCTWCGKNPEGKL